ncbi:lecithin retinol acyltransferase family protein [Ruegeria sp. EL01]|jgi:hypothetical protein|uniref:lecithin retinol acyltransferase family protein n=1 Tax=Ruegeria sp. EL01 TaxID=2107578 RepID=UPI000EA832B5
MKMKFEDTLRPGDLIVTSMRSYEHYSIVSDRRCPLGKLMLISARAETRTVGEECYDDVVRGRRTGLARSQSELPAYVILENARSQIGKWRYNYLIRNCEAFANWACGLKPTSRQVGGVVSGIVISLGATKLIAKNPSLSACLAMACVGGLIGLTATQELKASD